MGDTRHSDNGLHEDFTPQKQSGSAWYGNGRQAAGLLRLIGFRV